MGGQGRLQDVVLVENRLAHPEREQHRREHERERDDGEDDDLGPEHRQPLRNGDERRADASCRVLAGDDEDAEDADRQLRQVDAGERDVERVPVRPVMRAHVPPVRRGDGGEDRGQPDRQHDGGEERPPRRAQRVELRPLGDDHARLRDAADLLEARNRGGRCAHAAAALNSTSSRVSSMNASSSDAWTSVSSWSVMPFLAARSPTCSGVKPEIWSAPSSVSTVTPGPTTRSRSVVACGERTRTTAPDARLTNSSTLVSAISLPRPMTIRCSAVTAISLMRCDDTKTARPSAASCFSSVRIQWMPSGSRPLTGSSSRSVCGSPRSAVAMPSRCPMPSEKLPTRFLATSCRPTRSMSSSTRFFPIPCVCASARRWLYAERPV